MTYQQVIMRVLAGTWTWLKAADVLDIHPRSLRRWRARYEQDPMLGLLDRRRRRPSHRTAPRARGPAGPAALPGPLHGLQRPPLPPPGPAGSRGALSYSSSGSPSRRPARPQRARPGPPSPAARPAPASGSCSTSTAVTTRGWLLSGAPPDAHRGDRRRHQAAAHAQLWPEETTHAVLMPCARSSRPSGSPWPSTPTGPAGPFTRRRPGPHRSTHLTGVGRVLARLGIEHIPSYSPQARGRVERLNRTLQGRLVNGSGSRGSRPWRPPMPTCATSSFPTTTPSSPTRPPIPPAPSSRSARWTWMRCWRKRTSARRTGQCRRVRGRRPAARQAARPAQLRRAARHRAAPPQPRAHRLARPAVPGPLRRPGRPLDGPRPRRPEAPPAPAPRQPASRPKNARAHWLRTRVAGPPISRTSPRPVSATPPARAPAPGRPRRLTGQITCQNQADTSLVNNIARAVPCPTPRIRAPYSIGVDRSPADASREGSSGSRASQASASSRVRTSPSA